METINPGVFFTGVVMVALLAFAGTVGRHYRDELRREALESPTTRVIPEATTRGPRLTLIRGGRADAPHRRDSRREARAVPRAA